MKNAKVLLSIVAAIFLAVAYGKEAAAWLMSHAKFDVSVSIK